MMVRLLVFFQKVEGIWREEWEKGLRRATCAVRGGVVSGAYAQEASHFDVKGTAAWLIVRASDPWVFDFHASTCSDGRELRCGARSVQEWSAGKLGDWGIAGEGDGGFEGRD